MKEVESESDRELSMLEENVSYLYNKLSCKSLEWSSLTVEWLGADDLLLGTRADDEKGNYLLSLPVYERDSLSVNGQHLHHGPVNRARAMPQDRRLVATKTSSPEVYLYNFTDNTTTGLNGHSSGGYGLSWNPNNKGRLLSSGCDARICMWSLSRECANKPDLVFTGHESVVEDVAWYPKEESLFGSCGRDSKLFFWDVRVSTSSPILSGSEKDSLLCMDFNPQRPSTLLLAGSADHTVGLFDVRNLSKRLHTFRTHWDKVTQVHWHPDHSYIMASSAMDGRLLIWDLHRIGAAQSAEEAEDGPPELLFMHGAHMDVVTDFAWRPGDMWTIASVDHANTLQVWEMASHIHDAAH